jgi:hypothetical protein
MTCFREKQKIAGATGEVLVQTRKRETERETVRETVRETATATETETERETERATRERGGRATYADVSGRMLTYADVCGRMVTGQVLVQAGARERRRR